MLIEPKLSSSDSYFIALAVDFDDEWVGAGFIAIDEVEVVAIFNGAVSMSFSKSESSYEEF